MIHQINYVFSGHVGQDTGGTYMWMGDDADVVSSDILPNLTALSGVYSSSGFWDSFSGSRIKKVTQGSHVLSLIAYAPIGTTNSMMNGGGMQSATLPLDRSLTARGISQVFSCTASGITSIGATLVTVCSVNVTIPYPATVWTEFSGSGIPAASSIMLLGAVSFDGDAAAAIFAASTKDGSIAVIGGMYTMGNAAISGSSLTNPAGIPTCSPDVSRSTKIFNHQSSTYFYSIYWC